MNSFLNLLFFQAKNIAPQRNLGEVSLLAPVHPVLPAVQTGLWGRRVEAETSASGRGLTAAPADPAQVQMAPSISTTVKVETQAPTQALVSAQIQPPVPVSFQAGAIPDTPGSTLIKAPTSVPIQVPTAGHALVKAQVQAPVSATGPTFEPSKGSSTSSDTSSAIGEPKLSVLGLASVPIPVTLPVSVQTAAPASVAALVPAPVLMPPGIQTALSVSECASLATTQQNLEATSASSTLQHELCVEVGIKPKFAHCTSVILIFSHII